MTIVEQLKAAVEFFEARPALQHHFSSLFLRSGTIYSKAEFADAARVFGAGEKIVDDRDVRLRRAIGTGHIDLCGSRSNICRKVTKLVETEVWECPPILEGETAEATA